MIFHSRHYHCNNGCCDRVQGAPLVDDHHDVTDDGIIVGANHAIVDDSYPFHITDDWDSYSDGYRAQRILDVLSTTTNATAADMRKLQLDTVSLLAQDLAPLAALIPAALLTAEGLQLQRRLTDWRTYNVSADSVVAAGFHLWYQQLTTVTQAELGMQHYDVPMFVLSMVRGAVAMPAVDDVSCGLGGHASCMVCFAA